MRDDADEAGRRVTMREQVLQRLVRDHWVRLHGTPRVTVLVGAHGRAAWEAWLGAAGLEGTLLEGDLEGCVRQAVAAAQADPSRPIAIAAERAAAERWRSGRNDRYAALVAEGWVDADAADADLAPGAGRRGAPVAGGARVFDARSVAEATLFAALEATPATAGRFTLNASLSVRFGGRAAEVDLLSRGDRIAIEIDGYHHFDDADAYRRDRRKDLLLQLQGLVVVRLLAADVVRDARAAVNEVCQVLALRRAEGGS